MNSFKIWHFPNCKCQKNDQICEQDLKKNFL